MNSKITFKPSPVTSNYALIKYSHAFNNTFYWNTYYLYNIICEAF